MNSLTNPTILVVDDDLVNRILVCESLQHDYQTVEADCGAKALELLSSPPLPMLILLDVMMPEIDGFEVCRKLKQNQMTKDIPVIFLTAMADYESEVTGLECGAVDYVTKPIQIPILKARVKSQISLKLLQDRLQQKNTELLELMHLREDVAILTQHGHEISHEKTLLQTAKDVLEQTVAKLKEENSKRYQSEEKIRLQLEEKQLLLQEIHHRVKNNLMIISSLMTLQLNRIKDEEYAKLLQITQSRIDTIAFVHESLYTSKDMVNVDFNIYVQGLLDHLANVYFSTNTIRIEKNISAISMSIDNAIPCGLIIHELVINAAQHAFPASASAPPDKVITIHLSHTENGGYMLMVADNGIGMPAEFNIKKVRSLGITLVKTLSRQLKGDITLDSSEGATFNIIFTGVGT